MLLVLAIIGCGFAALSCVVYTVNAWVYRPARAPLTLDLPAISVLIPARNEQDGIGDAVVSLLGSDGVDIEVVVLDDHSDDDTAAIVNQLSVRDPRVRLIHSESVPAGWCGKQFACWQLAHAASHDVLLFIDADVRLAADAVSKATGELIRREVSLLSGVPRQIISGFADGLLIPLIHFILLGYLPMWMNRQRNDPSMAAGCGQFFVTTKAAYARAGGHETIKSSMHDGLNLPKAYRKAGETTDLVDITPLASCRMYEEPSDVWPGLAKNAVEGIANPSRIVPFTALLIGGHVLPWITLAASAITATTPAFVVSIAAIVLSLAVRLHAAWRYQQPLSSALLHPIGVLAFLGIQWTALIRHFTGHRPQWRGRGVVVEASNPMAVPSETA